MTWKNPQPRYLSGVAGFWAKTEKYRSEFEQSEGNTKHFS